MDITKFSAIVSTSLSVLLAIVMILPTAPSVMATTEKGEPINVLDIQTTSNSESAFVNFDEISSKAVKNQRIWGEIDNQTFSFILKEGIAGLDKTVCIDDNGSIDADATQLVRQTKLFTGTGLQGASSLTAVMTDDWLSMLIEIDGMEYSVDGHLSGASILYTVSNNMIDSIDGESCEVALPLNSSFENMIVPSSAFEERSNSSLDDTVGVSDATSQTLCAPSDMSVQSSFNDAANFSMSFGALGQSLLSTTTTTYQVKTLLASDQEYRNAKGSGWATQILIPFWSMNSEYMNQVGISFTPSYIVSVPSGYCTSTDSSTLLTQFKQYADSTWSSYSRECSFLCTGKTLNGGSLGAANEPGINAQRWSSSMSNYGLGNEVSTSFRNEWVMGHMIGHMFNGDQSYAKNYLQSGIGYDTWMYPTFGAYSSTTFSTDNARRIISWAQQAIDSVVTQNSGPSSTSAQNLQSSNLNIVAGAVYLVGSQASISYQLKNVGTSSITLNYVFIGARDANGNNRDFGYVNNVVIAPGSTYTYTTTYTPQYSGTWSMWPAYNYQGSWGPYQWITINPTFYYEVCSGWSGRETETAHNTWTLFYRLDVYSLASSPTVGSTVWVRYSLFNAQSGTSTTHLNDLFVGCRCGSTNKDFGSQGAKDVTQKSNSIAGGGNLVWASRTLDSSGTWQFWPAYNDAYGYGPYQWHYQTLTV